MLLLLFDLLLILLELLICLPRCHRLSVPDLLQVDLIIITSLVLTVQLLPLLGGLLGRSELLRGLTWPLELSRPMGVGY